MCLFCCLCENFSLGFSLVSGKCSVKGVFGFEIKMDYFGFIMSYFSYYKGFMLFIFLKL